MYDVLWCYQIVSWLIVYVALYKYTVEKYKVKGEDIPLSPVVVNTLLSVFLGWLILPLLIGYVIGLMISKLDK
jgi:hypothetical protein